MPSKKILDELHKIAQSNSTEEISYNDFKRDLLNSLNVTNDEYDEYLKIILNKARVDGKSLGEYNNGTFIISGSIIKIAKEEVSEKRKFIPGTEEFKKRMEAEGKSKATEDSLLIGKLLKDYSKLNLEEKLMLIGMTEKMDKAQFAEYKKGILSDLQDAYEKNIINKEEKAEVEESVFIQEIINENDLELNGLLCVIHRANEGSEDDIRKINQLMLDEEQPEEFKQMIEILYKETEYDTKCDAKYEEIHLEEEIDPERLAKIREESKKNVSRFVKILEATKDLNSGNRAAAEEKAEKMKEDGFDEVYKVFEESQDGYLYMSFMNRFIESETEKKYFSVDSDTIDLLEESYGKYGSSIREVNQNEDSELSELSAFAEGLKELSGISDQPVQDFSFEASKIFESEAATLDISAVQVLDYSGPKIPENKATAQDEITIVDLDVGEAEKTSEAPRIPKNHINFFTKDDIKNLTKNKTKPSGIKKFLKIIKGQAIAEIDSNKAFEIDSIA